MTPSARSGPQDGVLGAQGVGAAPRWGELFSPGLRRTTLGLLLMEGLVAIQVLVTVAVLPAVVADLGGVRLYGVALSASQVATVVVLPFTPRLVSRWGLRAVFYASVTTFAVGSVVVFTAADAAVFVVGILIQGAGSGALYALLLAIFTRRFPFRLRPRMYAALALAWAVPGLLGPLYGGLVASTLGWRWAFALILPLVVPAVAMLRPALFDRDASQDEGGAPGAGAATATLLVFSVAVLVSLVALSVGGSWGLGLGAPALLVAVIALRSILPRGTFVAARGLPAVVASGFLSSVVFYSVDGFLPAFLTGVVGMRLTVADLVVTCGVLAWTVGTWAQSRMAALWQVRRVAAVGETLMLAGVLGVVVAVSTSSSVLVFAAWALTGLGMGMTYPAIGVLATDQAVPGREVATLAQYQLADVLGTAVGPGMVGVAVTVTAARGLGLQDGLLFGFAVTCLVVLAALGASSRLPTSPALARETSG
ncbi:MAG TPA: MFS transporter [Actinomycetes bacterium]|nr:MFS transporter [Actinomycetes bacterium]